VLFKGNRGVPIQLEHGQEASDDDARESGIRNQLSKCERLALAESIDDV
jgi:hypothetical protein